MNKSALLAPLPGYELYLAPLEIELNPAEFERVSCAYIFSKYGHAMDFRKDGVTRYFEHPKGAASIYINELGGRNPEIIILTLLHDLKEDTYLLSLHRIKINFGKRIAYGIRALTKLPKGKETIEQYLARIVLDGAETIVAKLLDRLSNARDVLSLTPEAILKLVEETERYHLPILVPALKACGTEWIALADALEQKLKEAIAQARARLH